MLEDEGGRKKDKQRFQKRGNLWAIQALLMTGEEVPVVTYDEKTRETNT